jgi:hypothetical protein
MEMPATVRVEELGSDASSYRDAIDERRRVLHVRGSSSRIVAHRILWATAALVVVLAIDVVVAHETQVAVLRPAWMSLFLVGWLSVPLWALVVPFAAAQWAWRRAQWARFELRRGSLSVETGPFGARVEVSAASARCPSVVFREETWSKNLLQLHRWDLDVVEHDRRVLVATLFDEASARAIAASLAEAYRDSERVGPRDSFAQRFGPMPEGVWCEGDAHVPSERWVLEARCARGRFGYELLSELGLIVLAPSVVVAVAGCVGSIVNASPEPRTLPWLLCSGLIAILGSYAAWSVVDALHEQTRLCILRWRGRIRVVLDPRHVDVSTSPCRSTPLSYDRAIAPERLSLRVSPAGGSTEARLTVVLGTRETRLAAPVGLDEARYLAAIVEAFEDARLARRSSPHLRDSEYAEP